MALNSGLLCKWLIITIFTFFIFSILKVLLKSSKIFQLWTQIHPKDKERIHIIEEPLNLVGMISLLILELIIILIKVGFNFDGTTGDYPGLVFSIIPVSIGFLFIIYNLYFYLKGHKKENNKNSENADLTIQTRITIDNQRKTWHIIVFIILLASVFIGFITILTVSQISKNSPEYLQVVDIYWGSNNGLNYLEIVFIQHSIPLGQTILILVMFGVVITLLLIEITRLSNFFFSIFHKETNKTLLYKELDTFASYSHFAVGYFACAIILPPMLFLAALSLVAFADPAASIIGIRFGKKKYHWNEKSLEGTLAGSIITLIAMLPFVGVIYSLIGVVVFISIDLFTPKPIKISDNLLFSIIIIFVFAILSLLNIQAYNIFGV